MLYHERRADSRRKHTGKSSDREAAEEDKEIHEVAAREEEAETAAKKPKLEERDVVADASFMASGSTQVPSSFTPLVCQHTSDPRCSLCPSCFEPAQWSYPGNKEEVWLTMRVHLFYIH